MGLARQQRTATDEQRLHGDKLRRWMDGGEEHGGENPRLTGRNGFFGR